MRRRRYLEDGNQIQMQDLFLLHIYLLYMAVLLMMFWHEVKLLGLKCLGYGDILNFSCLDWCCSGYRPHHTRTHKMFHAAENTLVLAGVIEASSLWGHFLEEVKCEPMVQMICRCLDQKGEEAGPALRGGGAESQAKTRGVGVNRESGKRARNQASGQATWAALPAGQVFINHVGSVDPQRGCDN